MQAQRLCSQKEKINEQFNTQLYNFLDWCGKTFTWIKDFHMFRDVAWGYTKLFRHKLITNWYSHVNAHYKKQILTNDKQFFLDLNKDQLMKNVTNQDARKMLEEFDFDKVLHFKELFGSPNFNQKHENKIFTTMQILNKLSEKFHDINEQLEKMAF